MLVPLAALQQAPSDQKPGANSGHSQQRCVWRAVCPGLQAAGDASRWERHERWLRTGSGATLGLLAAPALPEPVSLADGRWAFEWTQSRRRRGTAPPMIRLAVCVRSGDGGEDQQQEEGQW